MLWRGWWWNGIPSRRGEENSRWRHRHGNSNLSSKNGGTYRGIESVLYPLVGPNDDEKSEISSWRRQDGKEARMRSSHHGMKPLRTVLRGPLSRSDEEVEKLGGAGSPMRNEACWRGMLLVPGWDQRHKHGHYGEGQSRQGATRRGR